MGSAILGPRAAAEAGATRSDLGSLAEPGVHATSTILADAGTRGDRTTRAEPNARDDPGTPTDPLIRTNPATPPRGEREVPLQELWQVGNAPDDPILGIVTSVVQDDAGNIGVLDAQQGIFLLFDSQGELLRRIGRQGQGPGEFEQASGICALPDGGYGVVQPMPGKVLCFDAAGAAAGTITPQPDSLMAASSFYVAHQAAPCGQRLVLYCLSQTFRNHRTFARETLALFGLDGRLLARLVETEREIDLDRRNDFDEAAMELLPRRWAVSPDERIYAAPSFADYRIEVFGPEGRKVMVITRDHERLERTQAEKDWVRLMRAAGSRQSVIEETHRAIERLAIGPGGELWVLPSRGFWRLPAGTLGRYDVFSADGRLRERVVLQGDADPLLDDIWIFEDRVIVVRNVKSALAAQFGGPAAGAALIDPAGGRDPDEPVVVVCYRLPAR